METPELPNVIPERALGISVSLDERDQSTWHHCNRVAGLSLELGKRCALPAQELTVLHMAATLHDVGKIGIPDSVLKKETPFSEDDWAVMKAHSGKSQRIVLAAGLEDGEMIGFAARHHHERFDGRGYPDGLAGEAIPILARIVAIADTYDAMATTRCYGHACKHSEIMEVLTREAGAQHDPWLYRHFATIIEGSKFKTAN